MCGIVGYIGHRCVLPILLDGLRRLEYRGYDSAGVAYIYEESIHRVRSEGKLGKLDLLLDGIRDRPSSIGVGHTRWATHGEPTEANAHPHTDCTGNLVVVHNGIIENYYTLRQQLQKEGHIFKSETDTEVLAHLIEKYLNVDLVKAVRDAMMEVEGAYAIGVLWQGNPDILVAARKQSPMVLGIADNECFLASDIPALLPYTRDVIFLDDGELAILSRNGAEVRRIDNGKPVAKAPQTISWDATMAEKAGYKHFMLKEIYEQPQAVLNTCRGRMMPEFGEVSLPEIELSSDSIKGLRRVVLLACGTSWHAGLVAKYWIEKWAGLPVEVDLASEFRYRHLILDGTVLTVPISQSGETADTLAGLRMAKELDSPVIAICNVVGSTITRESDGTVYTHAGPEIGVASTKAFTSQLSALYVLALYLSQARSSLARGDISSKISALISVPGLLEKGLVSWHQQTMELADIFYNYRDFLYLGRDIHFPVALEGALKLKEISYIHAEGYAAGEMKHGPIALIDRNMPVVALAPRDHVYEKVLSNVEEVKSRRGIIIALGEEGDEGISRITKHVVSVPRPEDPDINPFLYTIPLQLLAYEIAVLRGCDVDQPRNLAKSVTVE
ncbi:MAG: glutamine--fructose-6-phosphate transaminase (isomerizing) [Deltaproteobacteria bacterium]|nr:glutamine--fructose-6-phosphate transaminase (isomerizing) [Deltaproteobacteria bacterium]MBW2081297.1 glutamine--fructose-6-phosphate transaminase (isomerizing) [Deltaproteobacteria bacterium]